MTQLNLFEYLEKKYHPKLNIRSAEPPCYGCVFAIKRGHFRLCAIGHDGYKKIGIWDYCKDRKEDEDGKKNIPRRSVGKS